MADISDNCSECGRKRMTEEEKKKVEGILAYLAGEEFRVRYEIVTPPSDCINAIAITMQTQKITRSTPEKGRNAKPKETYENTILAQKRYCAYQTNAPIFGEEK